jgi:heme-degrading monooxygenase HmoA
MAVKVLIKRKVPENKSEELTKLLQHMRALTMIQPGYISGETLVRVDQPGETLVISSWQSAEDWRQWVLSKEREDIQRRVDELLGENTRYEIFEYP